MASSGTTAVGETPVRLTAYSLPNTYDVVVKADPANTNNVYVGFTADITDGSNPGTDGFILDASQELRVPRAAAAYTSDIWVVADAASQKVFWLTTGTPDYGTEGWAFDMSAVLNSGYGVFL